MPLQAVIDNINENRFLSEFSFSKNNFKPELESEIEFADHVILIDDLLIIFQLKERSQSKDYTSTTEKKWFQNKVLNISKKQIRNTLKYFENNEKIEIINQRGHKFDIKCNHISVFVKIIIYKPSEFLPQDCYSINHYISKKCGFIHILHINEYQNICNTFITPTEIAQYFGFRETILQQYSVWPDEKSIAGQFIAGATTSAPNKRFSDYVDSLDNDINNFDIFSLLEGFEKSIAYTIDNIGEKDYYIFLEEFAKLDRAELREIKKRIIKSIDECKTNKFTLPFRVVSLRTNCGFVFVPIEEGLKKQRIHGLKNFTIAAKYASRVSKQIGISFLKDNHIFYIDWCYIESKWEWNKEMEDKLITDFPFHSASKKEKIIYRINK